MPMGPDYIYCLVDRPGQNPNFWGLDASGNPKLAARPYFLEYSPDGWMELAIQNVRNRKYWGVDRSVSIPFGYVEDGATLLKHILYTLGPETPVYLKVCCRRLDYTPGVEYGYWYKQTYMGQVDFSSFNHKGTKVTCTTLEDGLPKYLRANENTVYELPMNAPESILVKMDGIRLHEQLNYQDVDGVDFDDTTVVNNGFTPTAYLNKDGDSINFSYQSQILQNVTPLTFPDKVSQTNCLAQNLSQQAITVRISGRSEFVGTKQNAGTPKWAFRRRFLTSSSTIPTQNDYQIQSSGFSVGQTVGTDFSVDVVMNPGDRLYSEGIFFGGISGSFGVQFTKNSKFKIEFITRQPATYVRHLRPQYILNELLKKITDGQYTADELDGVTNYFGTNRYDNVVFTCGNALRGFEDAVLKINFADFFGFWDGIDSVGITTTAAPGKVRMGTKPELIDFTNSISLGQVANLQVTMFKDVLFNELGIGYPIIKNEQGTLNGNDEYNCGFLFSMGTSLFPAKLNKVPNIKTSCYEQENTRIQTDGKVSTDYKNDNENYANHIGRNLIPANGDIPAHYELDRTLNVGATGLLEPDTVWNMFLSPKRNIERNGPYIRSCMMLQDMRMLRYVSCDKNNKLVTYVGGVKEEKADVNIGAMGDRFFIPVIFDFECIAPFDLLDLLDVNPLQVFNFDFDGNNYRGILVEVGLVPGADTKQNYKLLCTADNDITKLVDYYG